MAFKDIAGQTFGGLTALRVSEKRGPSGQILWECLCSCGSTTVKYGADLRSGHTKSCGCLQLLVVTKHGYARGRSHTRLYRIWKAMRARCFRETHDEYKNYGARGISVCKEWSLSFESFLAWAKSSGYQSHLQVDRVDVNGDYCPENCRWATQQENNQNQRRTKLDPVKIKAIRIAKQMGIMSQKEMATFFGVDPSTISNAVRRVNWSNI
jgi:hypothetical protein